MEKNYDYVVEPKIINGELETFLHFFTRMISEETAKRIYGGRSTSISILEEQCKKAHSKAEHKLAETKAEKERKLAEEKAKPAEKSKTEQAASSQEGHNSSKKADVASSLIKPITFTGMVDESGNLITDDSGSTTPPASTGYTNNQKVISKYPRLKEIEGAVRSIGFDCSFFETNEKLIGLTILQNGVPAQGMMFTIDLNKIILGPEPKWVPAFARRGDYEGFPWIPLSNLELMMKIIKGEASLEEVNAASIYDEKYIAVSHAVDINSFFASISPDMKKKMIDRLYEFIKRGFLDQSGYDYKKKFAMVQFTSIVQYTLRSDTKQIDVGKDKIVIGDVVKA